MKLLILLLGVMMFSAFTGLSVAYSQPLCPGLSGEARTACLRAESERTQREANNATRNSNNLNTAMRVACGANRVAGGAAGRVLGGKLAYKAGGAIGNAATGQEPCK